MKKLTSFILCLSLIISIALVSPKKHTVNSESPTLVKDTLSSSQLSYFGRTGVGTTMGDSIVKIVLNGSTTGPSFTTNNLFENDTVCISGTSLLNGCTTYTVQDIGNTAYFEVETGLSAMVGQTSSYVIATRSAQHIVSFTPQNNLTGGKWQFLLRASTGPENPMDGMPDQNGFDIGSNVGAQTTGPGARLASTDITCPWGMTVGAIGTTENIRASNSTIYYYHVITCSLAAGATNPINVGATWGIGNVSTALGTQIINPSPNRSNGEGNANAYNFFIRHLDSSSVVIDGDTARGQIAVVESVRVTATVDPSISFVIDNVGTTNSGVGNSKCMGAVPIGASSNVTATQVPFGSLQLATFNDLAQRVSAITNGKSYVVTVYEDAPLTLIGAATTIPNTSCDGGAATCTISVGQTWANPDSTPSKFGYSLAGVGGSLPGSIGFSGTNIYKAFGVGSTSAQTIFSNSATPTSWERVYVCYRLTVSTAQPAGNYENKLVYTATATF